jgi:hypothetical protein
MPRVIVPCAQAFIPYDGVDPQRDQGTLPLRRPLVLPSPNSTEDIMCYERRSFTSEEHKKADASANRSKERDSRREEAVSDLLRKANEADQKTSGTPAPAKEYIPAK